MKLIGKPNELRNINLLKMLKQFTRLENEKLNQNQKYDWLTEGMHDEFDSFIPIGDKEGKADDNLEIRNF